MESQEHDVDFLDKDENVIDLKLLKTIVQSSDANS
jgi:hypothetical protein